MSGSTAESPFPAPLDWFRTALSSIGDAVISTDAAGAVTYMNPVAERLTGWPMAEASGRPLREVFRIVREGDRVPVEDPAEKVIRLGVVVGLANHTILITREGSDRHIDDSAAPIRDAAGRLLGVIVIFRDITEKRAAERRVEESEERLRLMVEAVKDYAIFMLDPKGHIVSWNNGAQRIKGYTREEIVGRHFSTFYPAEDVRAGKPAWELEVAVREGRIEDEGWRVRKDGSLFWANVIITALWDEHGVLRGFGKVTRDLTERRRAEEEVRRANQELERRVAERTAELTAANADLEREIAERRRGEAERARLLAREQTARAEAERALRLKDEFLLTLSHELRTPLNAVVGWTQMVRGGRLEPDEVEKAMAVIDRNALSLTRLIEDLLDVARITSGKMVLRTRPVGPAEFVRSALDSVRPAMQAKGIELETRIDETAGIVLADPDRMQQAVWNLLTNAAKFTPRGGKVTLALRKAAGGQVQVAVTDTGVGIPAEFLPHVFERFSQAEGGTARRFGGLGIGLAIVRHLVELQGGTVTAESEGADRGATFTITLPAHKTETPSTPTSPAAASPGVSAAAETPAMAHIRLAGLKVLAVDDDHDTLEMIATALRKSGAIVSTAYSAAEAMEIIAADPPSLLIADIGMPGEDGHTLIARVRMLPLDRGGGIPAIALTAYARSEDRQKAIKAGYQVHVPKPLGPDKLVRIVAALTAVEGGA